MSAITIIGAGLSGLIASSILRDRVVAIHDTAPSLPNNHNALLRFRGTEVADATGIPFKRVQVLRGVHGSRGAIPDALAYSWKTSRMVEFRSIIGAENTPVTRYIAPPDLVAQLAGQTPEEIFKWGMDANSALNLGKRNKGSHPVISTIPMPHLMERLGYPHSPGIFHDAYRPGWSIRIYLDPEIFRAHATLYFPHEAAFYRASLNGGILILEGAGHIPGGWDKDAIRVMGIMAAEAFGLLAVGADEVRRAVGSGYFVYRETKFAKISPIPEEIRRDFIMWASRERAVYSLGRYATWRPGLLLDDIVNDVRVIQRMISGDSSAPYNWSKADEDERRRKAV